MSRLSDPEGEVILVPPSPEVLAGLVASETTLFLLIMNVLSATVVATMFSECDDRPSK